MENDIERLALGDNCKNNMDLFEKGVENIDSKHIEYFKARPPKFPKIQERDTIKNCYFLVIKDAPGLLIEKNTDLRKDIEEELKHLFEFYFGSQEKR